MRVFVRDVVGDTRLVECSPDTNAGALKAGSPLSVAPILGLKNGTLLQAIDVKPLQKLQMLKTSREEVFNLKARATQLVPPARSCHIVKR